MSASTRPDTPEAEEPPRSTTVRPEIQALRAGAALLVVLYHLWPGRVPGGFMGVDVFFVISGFLITSHLAREAGSTGRIRLTRFYARRARRLLPAAYLVLATSAAAVYLWVPQVHWTQNFRETIASALYFQNWRLASDSVDYLAADNAPSVAQHYWTLSVEEQFYLAWPLLILLGLWLATRARAHRLSVVTAVVAVATAASFAYSWWLTYANGPVAYFSTFTRAWEFGAGALLALLTLRASGARRRADVLDARLASLVSWAGLLVLAWCGLRLSGSTAFPGLAALLPVLGTVAVIAVGVPRARWSPRPLLENRFVQWTGDISYPLYLWHWPPLVVLPYVLDHDLGFVPRVGILVATFVAAALTKRFIEDPVRTGRRLGIRRSAVTFAFTAVAAALLTAACFAGIRHVEAATERTRELTARIQSDAPRCFGAASMAPGRPCHNPELDSMLIPDATAVVEDDANYPGCSAQSEIVKTCTFGDPDDPDLPHVVVAGDSHGRSLLPAFVRLAKEGKAYVTGHVKADCPWSANPYNGVDPTEAQECDDWRRSLTGWLEDNADDIDVLVVTALTSDKTPGTDAERIDGFVRTWQPVAELGVPIAVVRDNPFHRENPVDCLAAADQIRPDTCAISRDEAFSNFDPLTPASKQVRGTTLLDFTDFYCRDDTCPSVIGGVPVYRDKTHVSNTYMTTLAPYVWERLRDEGLGRRR